MFLLYNFFLNSKELLHHISLVKIVKPSEDSWDRKSYTVFTVSSTHEQQAHENTSQKIRVGGLNLIKYKIKYLLLQMLA
jgi:hypothetical protein